MVMGGTTGRRGAAVATILACLAGTTAAYLCTAEANIDPFLAKYPSEACEDFLINNQDHHEWAVATTKELCKQDPEGEKRCKRVPQDLKGWSPMGSKMKVPSGEEESFGCECLKHVPEADVARYLNCYATEGYPDSMLQTYKSRARWCRPLVLASPPKRPAATAEDAAAGTCDGANSSGDDCGVGGVHPEGMRRVGDRTYVMEETELDEAEQQRLLTRRNTRK